MTNRTVEAQPFPWRVSQNVLDAGAELDGERKHVTVFFADLKGSMELAEGLDPEEWARIIRRFFSLLSDGVQRFGGDGG